MAQTVLEIATAAAWTKAGPSNVFAATLQVPNKKRAGVQHESELFLPRRHVGLGQSLKILEDSASEKGPVENALPLGTNTQTT